MTASERLFPADAIRARMDALGHSEEAAAMVSVKNHANAFANPYAHFKKEVTVEEVLASKPLCWPIKLLDGDYEVNEVFFPDVRVPVENILLGEGRGFEIAQGRLGPGRIHHCMRMIGSAERALEKMCQRTASRVAFGRPISQQTVTLERIAESRIMIDQCRLLCFLAAEKMDQAGNKHARREIALIKVAAPKMLCQIVDWAIHLPRRDGNVAGTPHVHMLATARFWRPTGRCGARHWQWLANADQIRDLLRRLVGDVTGERHRLGVEPFRGRQAADQPVAQRRFGIDRLAMLFTDTTTIREVILFPTLKPE